MPFTDYAKKKLEEAMNVHDVKSHFNPAADRKTWEGRVEELIEGTNLSHHKAPHILKQQIMSMIADVCYANDLSKADANALKEKVKDPTKELNQLRNLIRNAETVRIVKHPRDGASYYTITTPQEIPDIGLISHLAEQGAVPIRDEVNPASS